MSVPSSGRAAAHPTPSTAAVDEAELNRAEVEVAPPEAAVDDVPRDTQEVAEPQPIVDELGRKHVVTEGPSTLTRIIGWDAVLFRATQKEGLRFERIVQDRKGNVLHVEQDTYVLSTRWVDDVDDAPNPGHDRPSDEPDPSSSMD
ncbi:MAG: hypothetical protein AAFU79_19595 [Myxococcota bacterium]